MSEDGALVLAAGKGTRMRSSLPKVLHELAGKSMLRRVLDTLDEAGYASPTVVVGYGADLIRQAIGDRCRYVDQGDQLGTGHAACVGVKTLPTSVKRVLVIHGDEPLIPPGIFPLMFGLQAEDGAAIVLLTARVRETRGFGRVIRDEGGRPAALRQEIDLTPEQQAVDEVNLGVYVFDASFLREHLPRLEPHAPKGEFYLTDLVETAVSEGLGVQAVLLPDGEELMGINDLVQLERSTQRIFRRTNRRLMEQGVTIVDSATTFIDEDVRIKPDTIIRPFTVITGQDTRIGGSCIIGPGAHIMSSEIGDHCRVLSSTVQESVVEDGVSIGPYANIGSQAHLGSGAEIGSYAQIRRSTIGPGTRMHHFGYLGDASVGKNVNIGAGTVTCNFDGTAKHETTIDDDAFIGSDTMLRAPVRIGRGAATGAGTVVTRDVPPGATMVGVPGRIMRKPAEPDESEPRRGG